MRSVRAWARAPWHCTCPVEIPTGETGAWRAGGVHHAHIQEMGEGERRQVELVRPCEAWQGKILAWLGPSAGSRATNEKERIRTGHAARRSTQINSLKSRERG